MKTSTLLHNPAVRGTGIALILLLSLSAGIITYQAGKSDFTTLSGNHYQWSSLEGQWVVLNYFAEWCAPCLREMPELNALAVALPANTHVFAINYDPKTAEELAAMVSKYNIKPEVIVAGPETVLPVERPPYLPATFIIDPQGRVADTLMGEVTEAGLRDRLATLKSESL